MNIQTPRLLIRPFEMSDFDALFQLLSNKEVMRFSINGPYTKEQTLQLLEKEILDHYAKHSYGLWAIIHLEDNCLIGYTGLKMQLIDSKQQIELGYRLLPRYWGKGLALEANRAIIDYAFNELDLDQLISIIEPQNSRSIKTAIRVGMHPVKETIFHEKPVVIYELQKIVVVPYQSEWPQQFAEEKEKLEQIYHEIPIYFDHIGSTSIIGCHAKPIIDILGVTPDITLIDSFNAAIESLGYEVRGENGMKQRRFFTKRSGTFVNFHLFEETNPEVKRHRRFRDYLNSHLNDARDYSKMKIGLAKQFAGNIDQYCLSKEAFVKAIDYKAALNAKKAPFKFSSDFRKKNWSRDEILKAMDSNMHLQMTYFAKYHPMMAVVFEFDVTVVRSQIVDDTFNYVLSTKFSDKQARARISHVTSLYTKQGLPFSWWVSEKDTPSNLSELLQEEGFSPKEEDVGMYLDLNTFTFLNKVSELSFNRVQSKEELRDFANVLVKIGGNRDAFDLIYEAIPPILYQEDIPYQMYVAYLNNEPIVTGILVLDANVAGLYYIATTPEQRKKGFGTEMMEYLLRQAKSFGYTIATLQASQAGKRLYERMGFQECCKFIEYHLKPLHH